MTGPGPNVFSTLQSAGGSPGQQSPDMLRHVSGHKPQYSGGEPLQGVSLDQTTMMTQNSQLQQNSVAQHQVSYDGVVGPLASDMQVTGGPHQFAAAPLT